MSEQADNFLAHYGIPGMRWGRSGGGKRGSRKLSSTPKGAISVKRSSADHIAVTAIRKKPVHSMSNAELKAYTTRVGLEKQYATLNPGKVAKGKAHLDRVMAVGKTVNEVVAFSKTPSGQMLKLAIGVGAAAGRHRK